MLFHLDMFIHQLNECVGEDTDGDDVIGAEQIILFIDVVIDRKWIPKTLTILLCFK